MKTTYHMSLLLLFLLCLGCGSKKRILSTKSRVIKDSISTQTRYKYRDTTIYVVGDTNTIKVPIIKIGQQPIYQQSGFTTLSLQRQGNAIVAQCHLDSLAIELQLRDKEIRMQRWYMERQEQTITIPKKYVPKLIKWLAFLGGAFLIALLLIFGIKILKR